MGVQQAQGRPLGRNLDGAQVDQVRTKDRHGNVALDLVAVPRRNPCLPRAGISSRSPSIFFWSMIRPFKRA